MLGVRGLAIARGGRLLLEGLSFSVDAGEALILRGPNGIGKTTLLRTLAGLQPAHAGQIETAEAVAYAAHADGIKEVLTVTENLGFWADLHGMEFAAGPVLAAFELTDLAERPAGQLSSGQKRRLGLARLGVIGARLLLLDEPTISLDAASVRGFGAWMRDHHLAQGGAAVIATHIDLGLEAPELDLTPYRAAAQALGGSDEVFL